jgi:glucokinase
VRAGDPIASAVWREAVDALGHAFAAAVTLLAPERIIVGGGLAQAGGLLLTPLEVQLESRLTFHRRPQLVTAVLGDRAGCLGAALLARDLVATSSH